MDSSSPEAEARPEFTDYERRVGNMHRRAFCKSCGAEIIWLLTYNRKRMPVDFDTVHPHDVMFSATSHTSHFATCPDAEAHRK